MKPSLRILLVLMTGCLCGLASGREADLLQKGDRLLEGGRVDDALVAWDRYKQQHPDRLEAYLRTARALLDAGRLHDASVELRDALSHPPATQSESIELARDVAETGNVRIASEVLESAREKAPLDLAGTWLLADLYYQERRFDEALDMLGRYEGLRGADLEQAALRRGMVLLEQGVLDRSMEAFEEAVGKDSSLAAGYHGLSKVCLLGHNPEAALKMSREAVRLAPDSGIYLFQLGVVLKTLGQNDEAIRRLEEAEAKGADAFGIRFELGDAFRRTGQMDRARAALTRYQELLEQRRNDQAVQQLEQEGRERLEKGEPSGAVETFRRLVERAPDSWTGHEHLAKLYLSAGNMPEAWSEIQRMLELDASSSEAHFLAALYRSVTGEEEAALRSALESRRLRPGNPPLRNLLGNLYFKRGDWRLAADEYAAASALDPSNAAFRANLESARRRLGDLP